MSDKESELLKIIVELTEVLQEIKFICKRAKRHYIEEKDIDDILELLKDKIRM